MTAKAQLIAYTVPSNDIEKSRLFYEALLGVEMAQSLNEEFPSYHAVVSAGVQFALNQRPGPGQVPMAQFAVQNVDQMVNSLVAHGGKKLTDHIEMPIAAAARDEFARNYRERGGAQAVGKSLGTLVVVEDPAGHLVGVVQLNAFAHDAFKRGALTLDDFKDHEVSIKTGRLVHPRTPTPHTPTPPPPRP